MSFLGTLLGVLCAIAFGVMFVKGSARINLQKFFKVTTAIMFLVAAQLLISGLHELSESGVIASSKREMAIIGPIVSNDWFFFVTIFAMAALMVLFEAKRRAPMLAPNASPAERRKATWTARRDRLWMGSVYTFSFIFIAMVTAEFVYTKNVSALSPATQVTFTNGKVSIRLSQVSDGDLHRFQAKENGTDVRFWLYQKPDGKIATVFDACEICGSVGFYKSANGVVCKNCAAPINRELRTIGANLVVTPQEDSLDVEIGGVNLKPPSDGAFLNEADLHKIKGIFWHNNITGFAPMLPVTAAVDHAGMRQDVTVLG